jgi:hypothetical protein
MHFVRLTGWKIGPTQGGLTTMTKAYPSSSKKKKKKKKKMVLKRENSPTKQ